MSSGYSRPEKFVREVAGVSSLEEAGILRQKPFWLVVHETAVDRAPNLVRALIAVAIRSCTGEVQVRVIGSNEFLNNIRTTALVEARNFECVTRISVSAFKNDEKLGAGITVGVQLPNMIAVDASGMYAAVNIVLPPGSPIPHSAASCFAAATGYAKYFAAFILGKGLSVDESWGFSLDTMTVSKSPAPEIASVTTGTNLGRIHLLGAGAIGSSFCFSIHLSEDGADIHILDREKYDVPNHETTFFLSEFEAARCHEKADYLATKSRRDGLRVTSLPKRELSKGDAFLDSSCDAFVCAVDNSETRRILDSAQCGILLNGGLGGTSLDAGHVLVSWHNGDVNDLSTLYPERSSLGNNNTTSLPKEISDECSTLEYESVSLAAPFMALSSGALLHAICRLNAEKRLPNTNYVKLDLLGIQSQIMRQLFR